MRKAIVGVLACALAVAFVACAPMGVTSRQGTCWESSTIVRAEGPDGMIAGNLSLGHMRWITSPADGSPGALLVRDGDLLYVKLQGKDDDKESEFIVPWRPEDGAELSLKIVGPRLLAAGQTVSLNLNSKDGGWDWLANASEKDLAALRFVKVDEAILDDRYGLLEKLARVNPHIGLSARAGAVLARVPSLNPRSLVLSDEGGPVAQAELDALATRTAIETLILGLKDADLNLQKLAALPNLRRLTLMDYESAKTAMPDLPRLESLTFASGTLLDLTQLKPLAGLRELNFMLSTVASLKGIEALPQLQELGLYCGEEKDKAPLDCAALDGLKRLRWVAFGGPDIAEGQFARVVLTHPDLQVVEVLKCEGIKNIAPLATLRELKALVLLLAKDNEVSTGPLDEMKQLRLLVLPPEMFKDKQGELAEIRGDLPGCVIAEGEPFCLGAGRILLLVPIVALGWMVIGRRRSRAACRAPCSVRA